MREKRGGDDGPTSGIPVRSVQLEELGQPVPLDRLWRYRTHHYYAASPEEFDILAFWDITSRSHKRGDGAVFSLGALNKIQLLDV